MLHNVSTLRAYFIETEEEYEPIFVSEAIIETKARKY